MKKFKDILLEEDLIAWFFMYPERFQLYSKKLSKDLFVSDFTRSVYLSIAKLSLTSNNFSEIDVVRDLGDSSSELGFDPSKLMSLKISAKAFNPEKAIETLGQYKLKRGIVNLIEEVDDIIEDADAVTILSVMNQGVMDISSKGANKEVSHIADVYENVVSQIETNAGGKKFSGIDTGSKALNYAIGGWKSGVTIIAARPSAGKSIVLLDVAKQSALSGKRVLFLSLEMPKDDVVYRAISSEDIGYTYNDLMNFRITQEQALEIRNSEAKKIKSLDIHFYDGANRDIDYLSRIITQEKLKNGVDIVCIDYLQLIRDKTIKSSEEFAQVNSVSNKLACLAKELNIPFVVLSQLSRSVESRQDKRPMLSDLRSSGNIEQDASLVIGLYRPYYYAVAEARSRNEPVPPMDYSIEFVILKQRNGMVGTIPRFCDVTTNRLADTEDDLFRFSKEPKDPFANSILNKQIDNPF